MWDPPSYSEEVYVWRKGDLKKSIWEQICEPFVYFFTVLWLWTRYQSWNPPLIQTVLVTVPLLRRDFMTKAIHGGFLTVSEAWAIIILAGSMVASRHGAGECIWELHPDLQAEEENWAWNGPWNLKAHPQWLTSSNKATTNLLIMLREFHSLVTKQ